MLRAEAHSDAVELVIARNPDEGSSLPYLLRLPLGAGLVFRVRDTWPRTTAVYCHPVPAAEWPAHPEIVERAPLRACRRRGAAIDIVVNRGRESRSQIVFTKARGRDVVFWQSPRTRKQARPGVEPPTGAAPGASGVTIVIDSRERYPYRFAGRPVALERRALAVGDYGVEGGGTLLAAVERKSLADLVSSIANGTLKFAMGDLAALPRAAVVVEDRYSALFKDSHLRPAAAADAVAELQVRWPSVPLVFLDSRPMAEEYVYRFLAAAAAHLRDDSVVEARLEGLAAATPAQIRAWATQQGIPVADRGRIRAEVVAAFRAANPV